MWKNEITTCVVNSKHRPKISKCDMKKNNWPLTSCPPTGYFVIYSRRNEVVYQIGWSPVLCTITSVFVVVILQYKLEIISVPWLIYPKSLMTAVRIINYNNSICRIFRAIWHHIYQPLAQHEREVTLPLHSRMMFIKTKVLNANATNSKGVCWKKISFGICFMY